MDDHSARQMELIGKLSKAFPKFHCLRCGSEDFRLRLFRDPALAPGLETDEVIETICFRCGFREQHAVASLERSLLQGSLPAGDGVAG